MGNFRGSTRRARAMVAGLAAGALALTGAVTAMVAASAPASAADVVVLNSDFEGATPDPWTGRGATVTLDADAHTGAQALKVTGRTASWNGTQVDASTLMTAGDYHITGWVKLVKGQAPAQLNFGVNQPGASNEYPWVGSRLDVTDSQWVQLDGTYSVLPATPPASLYIESDSATAEFLLDDVQITAPQQTTTVSSVDFEDGTTGAWTQSGGPTLAVVDNPDGAGKVLSITRNADYEGIQSPTGIFQAGVTYSFSMQARLGAGATSADVRFVAKPDYNWVGNTTLTNDAWTTVTGTWTAPADTSAAQVYIGSDNLDPAAPYEILVDDITITAPKASGPDLSLTPLKDTIDVPGVGVAVDSRETTGDASKLLLHHFNQITPENHMKVEAWYDENRNFRINPEAVDLMNFAQQNDVRVYGHVLVWHSQTPEWFFQHDDGTALTSSDADKQIMRDRLKTHIDNVAKALSDGWGAFGSGTNPLVGIDVVNEVVSDSDVGGDGLRRSTIYSILGEEFIADAFQYADEAFNHTYAAAGATRPVSLFINDYNTEGGGKQDRYYALVQRLLAAGVPVDGVGHQFHSSLTTPVSALDSTLTRFAALGLKQAVTELDVTLGTPVTQGNLIKQAYWYRDAFNVFRKHASDLFSVTVWGLDDARSWRSEQAPLLFDGTYGAKLAYTGAAGGELPPLLTTANVFGGDVPLDSSAADAVEWRSVPSEPLTSSAGTFVPRWSADHLTLLVTVASDASDTVEVTYGGQVYSVTKAGATTGGASAVVFDDAAGWRAVLHVPHSGVAAGDSAQLDVRALSGGTEVGGWNTPGTTGTLTFLEDLSTVDVAEATGDAPVIDGQVDAAWAAANVVSTGKKVEGADDGATATVRTLWKGDDTLYFLAEVTDPVIDTTSGDPWNQDSVELFLDMGNSKAGGYGPNDSQMRISVDNVRSYGTGSATAQDARLTSATARTATGYVVEAAISLRGQSGGQDDVALGGADTFQGLDFQVNDGRDGSRYSVFTWAEPTGTGYQSTSRWGVGHLVAAAPAVPVPPLTAAQLTDDLRGNGVTVPGQVKAGATAVVKVNNAKNKAVQVWFYGTEPTLTEATTSAKGEVTIQVPAGTPAGKVKVAAFDTAGNLLGWNEAKVR